MSRAAWLLAALAVLAAYAMARRTETVQTIEADAVEKFSSVLGELLARFEGFSDVPYLDEAGKWTIGYGHLIVPGDGYWSPSNPDGIRYISKDDARALKEQDAARFVDAVDSSVAIPPTENQRNAMISLAFNIGAYAFKTSSVLRLHNAGDTRGASDAFLRWNKITDPESGQLVVSPGLMARREQERDLYLA